MYYELSAGECRYTVTGSQESFAGYQCSDAVVFAGGTSHRVCQACGRQGQPACTNCYGQDANANTFCATTYSEISRNAGNFIIVPEGQTAQQWANDQYNYVCNTTGAPNCRPCGGPGQEVCPIIGSQQSANAEVLVSCDQVRQRYPSNTSGTCTAGNDGIVTGEATPVRAGITCAVSSGFASTVNCSLCGSYPQEACPVNQDYFAITDLRQACDAWRAANPTRSESCSAQ